MPSLKCQRVGEYHGHCSRCTKIFRQEELNHIGLCADCNSDHMGLVKEKQVAEKQKALIDATKRLADEIAKRSKNTAISPEFFDSVVKELGGVKDLGKRIANDFKRLHGEGLTAVEAKYFTHDEKTIQRYWQTIMTFMQQQDRMNAVDVSSLNDKELQATLLNLAAGLIEDNPEFREHVIGIVVQKDREMIERLAIEAGLIAPAVDGSVVAEPVKIEESLSAKEPDDPEEGVVATEDQSLYEVDFED